MTGSISNGTNNAILVTAAQGGSGRTMIAVALASYLTKHGTVAFVGTEVRERGYFGVPDSCATLGLSSPGSESWSGRSAASFDRTKLHLFDCTDISSPGFLSSQIAFLKRIYDFVVVSHKLEAGLGQESTVTSFNVRSVIDHAIVLYRQNCRSHTLTESLLVFLQDKLSPESSLILPVVNFRADDREMHLGQIWTDKALQRFHKVLEAVDTDIGWRDFLYPVDKLYYHTAIPALPYLSYGAVNIALNFADTDRFWPGYSVSLMAKFFLAAVENRPVIGK